MQDNNHSDYYDKPEKDKTEPFLEQYLPTSYDWRLSNCDERRSGPCRKMYDKISEHKFH